MRNLFIGLTVILATLMMWIFGSTQASAQIKFGNITINGTHVYSSNDDAIRKIVGSNERSVREVTLEKNFNYITASRGVVVEMSNEKGRKVKIEANSNVIEHIVCKNDGGNLIVTISDEVKSVSNLYAVITIPRNDNVNVYRASSAAKIYIRPNLTTSNVSMEASSAGGIHLGGIQCDKLLIDASSAANVSGGFRFKETALIQASSAANVQVSLLGEYASLKASSAANIKAQGQVNRLDVDASSAADIKAQELNSVTANAEASSGADVKINCSDKLKASASSGGDVRYKGDCEVERRTSSGGSVKEL